MKNHVELFSMVGKEDNMFFTKSVDKLFRK